MRFRTRLHYRFGVVSEVFWRGCLEPKARPNRKKREIEQPYETLRVRREFEGQLITKP